MCSVSFRINIMFRKLVIQSTFVQVTDPMIGRSGSVREVVLDIRGSGVVKNLSHRKIIPTRSNTD